MKPEGSDWTDEQWRAITETGKNIIVSAGAGSGKTTVLTERVIYHLKQGVSIDELIILTFTNAAAKEMKKKIRESIKKEEKLKANLALIDNAAITTFDAYSLSIVRKYHYLLNLKKDISIIDPIFLKIEKRKILDKIFLEMYEQAAFRNFMDLFTNKDDEMIKNKIDEINNKISGVFDKSKIFANKIDISAIKDEYKKLIKANIDFIGSLLDEILAKIKDEKITNYINVIKENFAENDNIFLRMQNYTFPSFPRGKGIDIEDSNLAKNYLVKVKKYFAELQELISFGDEIQIEKDLLESEKYSEIIIQILKKYNEEIFKLKMQYNTFEFNDILFLSIQILEENKEILEEIKSHTKEIMVDEFQDTNDNNEYFLSLISDNNLYMVGDIKQSIYRFRNANSKIFTDTYYRYQNGQGITIDLNKNFRSRKEVLENVNLIFEHIMDLDIGGVNYDNNQKLKFGNTNYQDNDWNHNLEILSYQYENYKKDFSKEEIEIFTIADDIIDKINNHYQVFDIKKKVFKEATYSDFVILLDRKTGFDLYKKIFEYKNIPLVIHKEESFSYNNMMFVLNNILKLVYAFYRNDLSDMNYPFTSLLRSYLCECSDNDILKNIDDLLNAEEFLSITNKIKYLSEYYRCHSLTELLMEIYKTFDMYMLTIKLNEIKENHIKLDYLLTISRNLENIGYGLKEFVSYFDTMFENNIDIDFNIEKGSNNAVNIMTIHKSKGLEFPVCYYASLYKEFNMRDVFDNFLYDNKYKIVAPIFKEGIKDTILKKLVKNNYLKEDIEEKIRLFYVALTRAKEKIIMVTNFDEKETLTLPYENIVNSSERLSYRCFNDMLISIKKHIKPYMKSIIPAPTKDYELVRKSNLGNQLKRIEKKYDYKKIDVQIEKNNVNYSEQYDITKVNELLVGNKIHEVLEYLDFKNYLQDLDQYDLDNNLKEKIKILFTMPFMKNLDIFYKEYQFIDNDRVGIIDLLIENEDKFLVIDYKTKEIHKESYINQVKKYMTYIKKNTTKRVEGYIYSIIDSEYIKIDEI